MPRRTSSCSGRRSTSRRSSDLPRRYLSLVARHLREAGTHRSTAEVIDGVRLAETLSALKDGLAPTLADLRDAAVTLLGHGELSTVKDALAHVDVGTAIGELPKGVSQTSIQSGLRARAGPPQAGKVHAPTVKQELELDLRENRRRQERGGGLSRPEPLLVLSSAARAGRLASPQPVATRQQSATWAEKWHLQWTPESEIALVEAVLLGETVELATAYKFKTQLESCTSIADAAVLVRDACQCGLMKSMELARRRLQELAATSSEFTAMAHAAWQLSLVVRYGDVRSFDPAAAPAAAGRAVRARLRSPSSRRPAATIEAAKTMLVGHRRAEPRRPGIPRPRRRAAVDRAAAETVRCRRPQSARSRAMPAPSCWSAG